MNTNLRFFACIIFLFYSFQMVFSQNPGSKIPSLPDKPVTEPTVFAPGIISTGDYEAAEEFSPDGKTLFYLKLTPDFNFWTMVSSRFEKGAWTAPEVAPFSGQYLDGDPFITADGKRFFFISGRPLPDSNSKETKNLDIWMMDKTTNGAWSEPRPIGAPINSEKSEYFPTLTDNGTLYFGSRRDGGKGGCDLYRSRFVNGKFLEPENLGDAINTTFDEYEPFIAPDESYLIFMADARPEGLGGYDFYISYNENGKWTKAENLGAPINTAANELSPKITRDGKYFFWTSSRSAIDKRKEKSWTIEEMTKAVRAPQNGLGDIYYIDAKRLKLRK
jgi:WD40-like Beta Propeller Repeat